VHKVQAAVTKENMAEGEMMDMEPESGSPEPGSTQEPVTAEQPQTEEIPAPPELQPVAEMEPLPEIPEMPDLPPRPVQPVAAAVTQAPKAPVTIKPTAAKISDGSTSGTPGAKGQPGNGSGSGNGKGTGTGNGTAPGNGKGGGGSARLKKGNMVRPVYPQAFQDAGKGGSVTISFTVDPAGKVISAHVTKPCPYPELNQNAVNVAYRWTFPRGDANDSGTIAVTFKSGEN
jgi:protein TonB